MPLLGDQGEALMQAFDSIRKEHERMDVASFNDDDLYKERINEVSLHPVILVLLRMFCSR